MTKATGFEGRLKTSAEFNQRQKKKVFSQAKTLFPSSSLTTRFFLSMSSDWNLTWRLHPGEGES